MFDSVVREAPSEGEALDAAALRGLIDAFAGLGGSTVSDEDAVDQLRELERVKSGAAAAQARITAQFETSRREADAAQGLSPDRQGRTVAAQVALARQDSPVRGGRHLGLAKALVKEMPRTLAALTRGDISEWRATVVVRETAVLTAEDRSRVDALLGDRLAGWGDRRVEQEVRKLGYHLDPSSALRRTRGANTDRRVSLRPAPDTMAYLTGFLPVAQGVAAHQALASHAAALKAAGDPRTKGQIMADTMIERLTGQATADDVSVEVGLVVTDRTLLGGDDESAHLHGYGPIPSGVARDLVRDTDAAVWLRRLFTSPEDGTLVAMDSRRRVFDGQLRHLIILRDQTCRTPWCDAPIKHLDHTIPVAGGGQTSAGNSQGLCEACNYAKEHPGWRARPDAGGAVETTTPTGHTYASQPPDPPGASPPRGQPGAGGSPPEQALSPLEACFADLILAA